MDRDTPAARRRRMERRDAGEPSSAVAGDTTNGGKTTWSWEAGGRLVETTRSVTAVLKNTSNTEEAEDEEWIVSDDGALPLIASKRDLPICCPEFPEGGSQEEIQEWLRASRVAEELAENDPVSNPPILRETKGRKIKGMKTPFTELISTRQREMVFRLSSSIVSVSSIPVGVGKEIPDWIFTGIVIGPSKSDKQCRILTSSKTVCNYDGKLLDHKLLIRFPNKKIKDAELVFFDPYYGIAVLESLVNEPLGCPSFVSSPEYGENVLVLARGKDSSLLTATGRVMFHNESYVECNCYLYVSCVLPENSTFGLVIDQDGDVAGLAFFVGLSKTAVIPSLIIRTLVEMERNFRCIARPVHGLCLRALQFLDIHKREEILYEHNIEMGSTAEIVGIRDGDLIVSFNGIHLMTMPELEYYLLSLGWKFLQRKNKSSKVILKLKVYDPIKCEEHIFNLPLGFSCLPSMKEETSTSTKRKKATPVQMPFGMLLRPRKKK